MFEGVPNYPDCVALLAGDRQAQGHAVLHRADRDPRADARRRRAGEEDLARNRCACSARSASRSIRKRGSGITRVVGDGALPDRRHLVADRNRRHPDHRRCPARSTPSRARRRCRFSACKPAIVDANGAVLEGAAEGNLVLTRFLARADAHACTATTSASSTPISGPIPACISPATAPPRRRRLLLDHRPRRRRDQRQRPPPRHRRSRKRAGRASEGRRGRGRRLPARHQGPGHLCLRHAERRRGGRAMRCARN